MDKLNEKLKKALKKAVKKSSKKSRKRKLSDSLSLGDDLAQLDDNESHPDSPVAGTSKSSNDNSTATTSTVIDHSATPSTSAEDSTVTQPQTSTDNTTGATTIDQSQTPSTSVKTSTVTRPDVDALFAERTPLYENEHLTVFVVKDFLKRQKIFRLDDHLYTVKIKLKDGHPPLLSSLLDVLRKVFVFIVKSIKNFYPKGKFIYLSNS